MSHVKVLKRSFQGLLFGALWLSCIHVAQADRAPAQSRASIASFCTAGGRLTRVELTSKDGALWVSPMCVDDGPRQSPQGRPITVSLAPGSSVPRSVYALESAEVFDIQVGLEAGTQLIQARFRDGRHCATVSATAHARPPLPGLFLGNSRDWRQAVDYMVDAGCTVMVVRAGNKVAVATVSERPVFDLYGIRFAIK